MLSGFVTANNYTKCNKDAQDSLAGRNRISIFYTSKPLPRKICPVEGVKRTRSDSAVTPQKPCFAIQKYKISRFLQ